MRLQRARLAGAVASAPALVAAVAIAALRTPGYGNWRDPVSRLGSPGQPWAHFVQIAFIGYGFLVLAGSGAIAELRRAPPVFLTSLQIYAACAVVAGLAPKDMPGVPHTTGSQLHVYATVAGGVAVISAMALTAATDSSRWLRVLSVAAVLAVVSASVVFRFTWGSSYYGATERVIVVSVVVWVSAAATFAWRECRTLLPTTADDGGMDEAVRDYIEAIVPEHRALFDRIHRLILEVHPEAVVVLSYKMPTYKVESRRLFVGVWKHGVSIYGWEQGRDAGFSARHPELKTSQGTIRLRPDAAAAIPDDELRDLVRAALDG